MSDDAEGPMETRGIGKYRERIVSGPIIRTIFWLGTPPLVNQLVIVAYSVANTYWLSSYSEIATAVPRQVWPVSMLFQALAMALSAASLSIISQYIGGKAYKSASQEASRFFTVSFFAGGALCLSLLALRGPIFSLIVDTPPEISDYVMAYSGVVAFDVFFNYLALTYTTILQSVGDTRRPAIVNVVAVVVNVVLDPFVILGIGPFPRLGVVGAALTDVLGKIISICILTYILRRSYPELKIRLTKDINEEWTRLVLRISLPVLALTSTNGFAFLVQLRLVNMLGIAVATAYSIGFVILDTVDAALFGLSGAPAIMIGQSLGAGNRKRARDVALKATLLILALMAIGAVIVYPIRGIVADVFADDPNILYETSLFLQIILPTLPLFGVFFCAMSAGRGSGHTLFPTSLGIMRLWAIRLTLGYILAFTFAMGSLGIWTAFTLSNIVGGVIAILWIKYGNWAQAVVKKGSE